MTASSSSSRTGLPWVLALIGVAVLGFVVWGFWRAAQPPAPYFQGQMEAREADIAPKVTARIARRIVRRLPFASWKKGAANRIVARGVPTGAMRSLCSSIRPPHAGQP